MKRIPPCDPLPLWTGHTVPRTHVLFVPASGIPVAPVPAPLLSLILPPKQALPHTFHQQSPLFIFQGHQRETEVS